MIVRAGGEVWKDGGRQEEGGRGDMLPGYDKQHTTDTQASQQNIHPDVGREGVEEGEDPGVGPVGLPVEYTYPQRHERLGEVDDLLSHVGDGQGSHRQVHFL